MDKSSKYIQLQYQGFENTPQLWKSDAIFDLQQLEISKQKTTLFNEIIPDNLRLGKRVERFVLSELQHSDSVEILVENVQIQDNKITIGELDCLLNLNANPIHLEIVYKFYLHDSSVGSSELDHWIGPNKNDSLIKKLTKLKSKQLPLLYNPKSKPLLDSLNLTTKSIKQHVYFKAQLFIPYNSDIKFDLLNEECLAGFYIHYSEIDQFSEAKFYIPSKLNWLLQVHSQVDWVNFDQFELDLSPLVQSQTSPLCWIKNKNGTIQKLFIVWWDVAS